MTDYCVCTSVIPHLTPPAYAAWSETCRAIGSTECHVQRSLSACGRPPPSYTAGLQTLHCHCAPLPPACRPCLPSVRPSLACWPASWLCAPVQALLKEVTSIPLLVTTGRGAGGPHAGEAFRMHPAAGPGSYHRRRLLEDGTGRARRVGLREHPAWPRCAGGVMQGAEASGGCYRHFKRGQ